MGTPIESATRTTIRQRVGYNLGSIIVSSANATGSTTTLIDTVGLAKGGDDEYNGCHLRILTQAVLTSNVGVNRWVTDFDSATSKLTFAAMTDVSASGDTYELWRAPYDIYQLNTKITEAEGAVLPFVYVDKMDATTFTEMGRYLYSIPSGFVTLNAIEYDTGQAEYEKIEDCTTVWDESVDTDVTATADTALRDNETWLKLVVAAGASANDILATQAISALDLRDCTEVEISVYSTTTLAAGAMQLLLDNTASCASPVESLDIPATTANTFTRHIISLANPQNDGAIISVGIKMVTDATFTFFCRKIRAVRANSRQYEELNPVHWDIVRGSTNYLKLSEDGLGITGDDCLLRLNGYSSPTAMSADSSTSEVNPDYIVNFVTGRLLQNNEPSKAQTYLQLAENQRKAISTSLAPNTRFI